LLELLWLRYPQSCSRPLGLQVDCPHVSQRKHMVVHLMSILFKERLCGGVLLGFRLCPALWWSNHTECLHTHQSRGPSRHAHHSRHPVLRCSPLPQRAAPRLQLAAIRWSCQVACLPCSAHALGGKAKQVRCLLDDLGRRLASAMAGAHLQPPCRRSSSGCRHAH
jgi:hypothetical protein